MELKGFHRDLGASPVQADKAVGGNLRDGQNYGALQTQIDLLTDIHATTQPDWQNVVQLASEILAEQGKDLSVGVWLVVALFHTRQLAGLADGIHVLRDLIMIHWDDMSPPATRLRGRRNQMQWLLDQLSDELQQMDESVVALSEDSHQELLADWNAVDATWNEHDDDAPAFYGLRGMLGNLPVNSSVKPEHNEVVSDVSVERQSARPEATHVVDAIAEESTSAAQSITVDACSVSSNTSHIVSAGGSTLPPLAPASGSTLSSAGSDPGTLAETGLSHLRPLIDWCLTEHPTLPLLFRLTRLCAWTTLECAPPSQNGVTRLPPPPDQVVLSHEQIAQTGEAQAAIHYAESRLIAHRYWLDLNYTSHKALTRLGANDAAMTVAFETSRLLTRLPGLAGMKFSDGRPFANTDTQAWLLSLNQSAPPANDVADMDTLSALVKTAQTDAMNGKLAEALDALQVAAQRTSSHRDQFQLRLAQCSLLQRFDGRTDTRLLLAPLIDALDTHRLCTWEPDLARQALQLAAAVELRHPTPDSRCNDSMLARLASMDPRAAWQLSQSTTAA